MAMKCPVCKNESPEGKKYCAECGAELPQPGQTPEEQPIVAVSTVPKAHTMRRRWLIPIHAVAISAILIGAALGVYFSPDYSWDASIRDYDGDGYCDSEDLFPCDSTEWIDTDVDGYGDNCDCFPEDGDEWQDTDGDGVGDNADDLPTEPTQWVDSDRDGYGDNSTGVGPDAFPDNPCEWNDTDGDGVGDNGDAFPEDPDEWQDTDGDGVGDNADAFPEDESRSTPVVRFVYEIEFDGFSFECIYVDMPIAWDDVTFTLTDYTSTVVWTTASSSILTGSLDAIQYLGVRSIAGIDVTLVVTDIDGNGTLEKRDAFVITSEDEFEAGVEFLLEVIYEPTNGTMDTVTFMIPSPDETPTSALTKTAVTSGLKLTFAPMSVDTQWDDITILLSDGTNTVQWSPATANLDNSTTAKELLGAETLTSLSVYCNVTDLAGNGYVNLGDYIVLTTGGGSFALSTTYTVTIIHDPTAGEVCHISFNG